MCKGNKYIDLSWLAKNDFDHNFDNRDGHHDHQDLMHQHGDHDIHHYHDHVVGQVSWWVTMNGCKLYDADDDHH